MKSFGIIGFRIWLAGALIGLVALPVSAQNAAQNQTRIRGIVESFNAPTLVVKTPDGQTISVIVPGTLRIMANAKTSLADIKPGDFVGSAADKGPDGKLHAEEVHVFPEVMRGTGDGHRPMAPDPARAATPATNDPETRSMTNGTVTAVANDPEARTMTNGTVSGVAGSSTRTLQIAYKGGVQDVEIGPDVPVITLVVADASLLKPGATVAIVAVPKDGVLTVTNLTAEKDGVKPR